MSSLSKASSAPANKPSPLVLGLIKIRADTERLGALLQPALLDNPPVKGTLDELKRSVSRALQLVDFEQRSPSGEKRKAASAGRRLRRRRSSQPYSWRSISKTLHDGHTWRKYGQKDIQSAKYPRSYYRCTHKNDQGCKAIRQVQASEEDPSSYVITYLGEHTCRDPSMDLAGQLPLLAGSHSHLISFGCSGVIKEEEAPAAVPSLKHEFFEEEVISSLSTDGSSSPEDYFTAVPSDGGEADELELMVHMMEFETLPVFDGGAGGSCFLSGNLGF